MGSIFTDLGVTAHLTDAFLLVLVVAPGPLDAGVAGEDDLGPAGGEVPAPTGRSGLEQDRATLGRARDGQGTPGPEPLALMVQLVDLVRVGEHAADPVEHEGVVLPGVPQSGRGLEELVGPVIALVVAQHLVDTVILRFAVVHRGHNVPRGPATGEMVQGGEGPGHVERRVVGGRVGGAETDRPCGTRQDTEHDAQVELDRAGAVANGLGHRTAVDTGHGQAVVEEHHVEAALLEGASQLGVVARSQKTVLGGGVAPRTGVDGGVPCLHEPH